MVALAAIAAVGLGIPLLWAAVTGSLAIPHNDTWAYSKIAQGFGRSGSVRLWGWNRGALVGQIVPLAGLARFIVAQQLFVWILGVGAVLCAYLLVNRQFGRGWGVLAAAVLAFAPGYALLSTSFMEDVPAVFAILACLTVGDLALRRRSHVLFWAALAVGAWGFTIREQVIAAPVALLLGAGWQVRRSRTALVRLGVVLLLLLAVFGVFELWRGGLRYSDSPQYGFAPQRVLHLSIRSYITLALLVSPAVLIAAPRSLRSRSRLIGFAAVAVVEVAAMIAIPTARGFLGNYLSSDGAYATAVPGTQVVLSGDVMAVLVGVAVLSGALLPFVVVDGAARLGPTVLSFTALTLIGTLIEIGVGQSLFDRYLLPIVVPLVMACARPGDGPSRRWIPSVVVLAGVAAVSVLLTVSALGRDAAVWHAAKSLVRGGVPASDIDAGFDWIGTHSADVADQQRAASVTGPGHYVALFADARACYRVSLSPPPPGELIGTQTYRQFVIVGRSTVYVSRTGLCR